MSTIKKDLTQISLLNQFLVVDTGSVGTAIAVGQIVAILSLTQMYTKSIIQRETN